MKSKFEMQKTLVELNEELVQFLMKKHRNNPHFLFRTKTRDEKKSLSEGYWFITHKNHKPPFITTSFWNGNDKKSSKPHIRINIIPQLDIISFDFSFQYSEDLKNLFENLAEELNMSKHPKTSLIAWTKEVKVTDDDYQDYIDNFIKNDKGIIDDAIKIALKSNENLENLRFIEPNDFKKWINNINKYRTTPL